jgi:hypothetical protein
MGLFFFFLHRSGHGVGELFHCSPTVPHYANNKATGRMQAGHIFTIEPMINEGDWKEVNMVFCCCCCCRFFTLYDSFQRCDGPMTGLLRRLTENEALSLKKQFSLRKLDAKF